MNLIKQILFFIVLFINYLIGIVNQNYKVNIDYAIIICTSNYKTENEIKEQLSTPIFNRLMQLSILRICLMAKKK